MIISIRLVNFFSINEEIAIDFTAVGSSRNMQNHLPENLLMFNGDKFVNIIGMFGSNAAGKSNLIKAIDFCRNLIVSSHLNNYDDVLDFEPFKFDKEKPSEFYIDFVTDGVEYEYSFRLTRDRIIDECLYQFPKKRKALVFCRENTNFYRHVKGNIARPTEVEASTGRKTLFLSRASSMNRALAQKIVRFFNQEIIIGTGNFDISALPIDTFEKYKSLILKGFEIGDSDITDIRLIENAPGQRQLLSYHKENPAIAFDFVKEESEGTKRLLSILLLLIKTSSTGATVFIDEFDLKLHLRLAEFLLDVVRASRSCQFVFTSHNPYLINTQALRREQIVFVNKDMKGMSTFVPLSDYDGISERTDIRNAYLQGRFDAVPYIGNVYNNITEMLGRK